MMRSKDEVPMPSNKFSDIAESDAYHAKHLTPQQQAFADRARAILGPMPEPFEPVKIIDPAPTVVPSVDEINRAAATERLLQQISRVIATVPGVGQ